MSFAAMSGRSRDDRLALAHQPLAHPREDRPGALTHEHWIATGAAMPTEARATKKTIAPACPAAPPPLSAMAAPAAIVSRRFLGLTAAKPAATAAALAGVNVSTFSIQPGARAPRRRAGVPSTAEPPRPAAASRGRVAARPPMLPSCRSCWHAPRPPRAAPRFPAPPAPTSSPPGTKSPRRGPRRR